MNKQLSIYGEDEVVSDNQPVDVSSANRVISVLKKRQVVVLLLPGEFTWAPPIIPNTYSDDTELHTWVNDAIQHGCIILHCVDGKIPYVERVCEILHFHLFLISGVLGHEMSGVAKSITSHIDTVNQLDVEHIATFMDTDDIVASLREEADSINDKYADELKTLDEEA